MINIVYVLIGIISGIICSYLAKQYNRSQSDWYILGQVFPIISIILVIIISNSPIKSQSNLISEVGNN